MDWRGFHQKEPLTVVPKMAPVVNETRAQAIRRILNRLRELQVPAKILADLEKWATENVEGWVTHELR
jgi:hypothetical protein